MEQVPNKHMPRHTAAATSHRITTLHKHPFPLLYIPPPSLKPDKVLRAGLHIPARTRVLLSAPGQPRCEQLLCFCLLSAPIDLEQLFVAHAALCGEVSVIITAAQALWQVLIDVAVLEGHDPRQGFLVRRRKRSRICVLKQHCHTSRCRFLSWRGAYVKVVGVPLPRGEEWPLVCEVWVFRQLQRVPTRFIRVGRSQARACRGKICRAGV